MKTIARGRDKKQIKGHTAVYAELSPGPPTTSLVFFPLPDPASPIIVENISPWVFYLENEDYA